MKKNKSFCRPKRGWYCQNSLQSGFTLMEILVALGILMIGLTSAVALLGAATASHKKAVDQTNSAFVVQWVISDVKTKLSKVKKIEDLKVMGQRVVGYPFYSYDVYVHGLNKDKNEVFVAVSVYWDQGGRKHAKTYQTILLRK